MINFLCEPTHLWIIISALAVMLVLAGAGKSVGTLLGPLIRKIFGGVTVNVGTDRNEEESMVGSGKKKEECGKEGCGHFVLADAKIMWEELSKQRCGDHELIRQRQDGILKDIAFLIDDCKIIWLEIKDINLRQISLREKLPNQYVAKGDLLGINERLKSIDDKLDRYMERTMKAN